MWEIFTIHGSQHHGTARENSLDNKWPFIGGSLFASGVALWKNDSFYHQVTSLIYSRLDLFVESLDHTFLIPLTMKNSSQSFIIDQVQQIQPSRIITIKENE